MRYMQIKSGNKLHLVYEPGEGIDNRHLVKAGHLSHPICGVSVNNPEYVQGYRMTINAPLSHACKNCVRIRRARHGRKS